MRFFYRCAVCQAGFWHETTIENNNVECLHCESSGHETIYDAKHLKEIPKLHRVQIWTNEDGEVELPAHSFECGECGHEFGLFTGMDPEEAASRRCPQCKAPADKRKSLPGASVPHYIQDIAGQEGRKSTPAEDHIFGEGARVASKRQLTSYNRITKDPFFHNTYGENSVMTPVRDNDTGKVTMDGSGKEPAVADLSV